MSELLDAIENFDQQRVERLLAAGADPNVRGFAGMTPLHLAVDMEMEDAICRFDQEGVRVEPDGALIQLLVNYGANVRAQDEKGETPLDWAKRRKHQAAIRVITGEGAV